MKYIFRLIFIALIGIAFQSCKTAKSKDGAISVLDYRSKMAFEDRFYAASKARLLENFDEAQHLYLECLKIKPNDDASLYELARLSFLKDKKYNEALDYITKAIKSNKNNVWYYGTLANIYAKQGNYSEAASIYEKVTTKNPKRIDFYYEWANMLLMSSKYSDAIKVYNKLENITGTSEEISFQKEKIYLAIGKNDDAIEEMKKLSEAYPSNTQYMNMIAELYLAMKKPEKATPIYEKVLELNPKDGTAEVSLAEYYMRTKQNEKAFVYLESAFSNNEVEIDLKMKILLDLYAISEKDSSILTESYKLGEILAVTHPKDPKAFSILGDFYYRDKNLKKARENFEKVLQLESTKYVVWEQLLYIYAQQNDFVAMQEKSKTALEYFPIQPLPYYFNGFSNIQLKNYEQAQKSLNKGKGFVVENNNLLAEFYSSLGECYQYMHNFKESSTSYDKALELYPDNAFVLNNYSYYLSLRKERLDKAMEMSEKANKLVPNSPSFEDTYGWICFQRKDYVNAEIWTKKSLDNGGSKDGSVLEHYGDILFKQNKITDALNYWKRAKEIGGASDKIDKKISEQKLDEE